MYSLVPLIRFLRLTLRLTTKGRYAVTAILDLAFHSQIRPITLTEIAARQSISLSYLEQLFARLRKAEIVIGMRGPGGGYKLKRSAWEINIAEIILAVDEQIDATKCGGKGNCHNNQPCLTHNLWAGLSDQIHDYLQGISLGSLLEDQDIKHVAARQQQDIEAMVSCELVNGLKVL